MTDKKDGCVKPSKGVISATPTGEATQPTMTKEVSMQHARVGKPAPDFELSSYFDGGFKNVRLSDHKGKWIVICFYPGDFTFV